MANVSDQSSNNKIDIVTNVENNVTVTQPNIQTVTVKTGPIGPAGAAGVSGSDGAAGAPGTLTNNSGASITGSLIVTGTVSASRVTSTTGSFTHIQGNSPITIQDSVTFQQPVTGSIFSGSFVGDGTNITGVTATLPNGILSGSDQIASNISGSFTAPSSSFSTRITSLESGGVSITPGTVSSSLQITQLGFVTSSATSSFITSLPNGLLSGSSQIATEISGAFASPFTSVGISGSFNISSASFSTRVTTLEAGGGSGFTSAGISGSLGVNASLIRSLTAANISGSFTAPSSSFSTRVTTLENNPTVTSGTVSSSLQITQLGFVTSSATASFVTNSQTGSFITILPSGLLSGSAQIATEISGAFGIVSSSLASRIATVEDHEHSTFALKTAVSGAFAAPSASFSTRTTALESNPVFSASSISGSSNALSASFSTRVTTNTTNITSLTAATSSYLTSLPTGVLSGSAQIASNISGSFTSTSSSLASRTSTLEGNPVFSSAGISGSLGANATLIRSLTSVGISGSFIAPSSSFSSRVTTNETNITSLTAATSSYLTSLPTGVLSGSAQIASNISGSFGSTSSSLATRITTNATNISTNTSNVSSNLTKINSLTAATASLVAETLSIFRQEGSPAPGTGATQSIAVTVADVNGENKYVLGGVVTGSVVMNQGDAYKFDQSDGTNDGHPFRFSTDEGGSSNYSTGVTTAGVPGQAGSYTLISVTATTTAPLYYYCSSHSGMGTGVLSIDSGSLISTGFAKITGSLIVSSSNVDFLQSTGVSGSFSGSFEGNGSGLTGIVNASTASFISSTFISASAAASGFGSGGGGSSFTAAGISGSFTAPSASFSTRVTTLEAGGTPTFIASGSTSASADPGTGVVIEHSGSTAFSVIGDVGTLFSVDDDLTGTLFSVNDISGIPQLEVSASGKVEVGKGPLIANTFETGSITNGSPSSPLQMTFPSGSSKQLFGVGGYHRASWDDGAADHIWFQDDNIRLSYDLSGVDIEGTITKDPKVGEIHIITIKDGTYSALDKQVSDGIFDLNGSFGSDNTDTYTFAAPKDPTWPYYRVTVSSTSAAHDSYFYAIVEKFI